MNVSLRVQVQVPRYTCDQPCCDAHPIRRHDSGILYGLVRRPVVDVIALASTFFPRNLVLLLLAPLRH